MRLTIVGWQPDMTSAEVQTAFGSDVGQLDSRLCARISPDSTEFITSVPSALAAQQLGELSLPLHGTPPLWMKSNDSTAGGYLLPSAYAAYAAHLKAFVDTMAKYGVSIYAVSLQNEPDAKVTYELCYSDCDKSLLISSNIMHPQSARRFLCLNRKVSFTLFQIRLSTTPSLRQMSDLSPDIFMEISPTTYPLAASRGKEVWMTEHYTTSTDSGNVWPLALNVGKEINDCMNANMSAYVWWYIVRFYGPIDENGNVTKRGYVMSHYSRFIYPGYYRVYTVTPYVRGSLSIALSAYKSPTQIILEAINLNSSTVRDSIVYGT